MIPTTACKCSFSVCQDLYVARLGLFDVQTCFTFTECVLGSMIVIDAGGRLVSLPRPLRSNVRAMNLTLRSSKNGTILACSMKVAVGKRHLGEGRRQA